MPDEQQFQMDDDQRRKADKWLKEKWLKDLAHCPFCGHSVWQTQNSLGIVPLFKGGATIAGAGFPALVAICVNCGYMAFINAIIMGLTGKGKEGASDVK